MVRRLLALLRRAGFDYSCFRVFSLRLDTDADARSATLPAGYRCAELSPTDLGTCPFPELRDCEEYTGPDSVLFGIFRGDGVLVCVQCVWCGDRYRQHAFWPFEAGGAASMHLVTTASEQGKGLATRLKQYSAKQLKQRGYSRLYSRIWWTNKASLRVSEKAGWERVGTVLEIVLPWHRGPIRRVYVEGRRSKARAG